MIATSLGLHWLLLKGGELTPKWAAYGAVAVGAGLVTFFEAHLSSPRDWRRQRREAGQDLVLLVLVQMALPPVLLLTFVVALQPMMAQQAGAITNLWPHEWPWLGQLVLMLLVADFLRYWLHRACHRYAWLWRLHAVHHSPKRLYWLNVGQFHPLDNLV